MHPFAGTFALRQVLQSIVSRRDSIDNRFGFDYIRSIEFVRLELQISDVGRWLLGVI